MDDPVFRFNVGEIECLVVSDGSISVPGPLRQGGQTQSGDRPHEVMDINCLLVRNGDRNTLVDTGCGTFFQSTAGRLKENLLKTGVDPRDINTIVYTHGHPDHIGGAFDAGGSPVYPNARQVVSRREWDCWAAADGAASRMFNLARRILVPAAGSFDMVDENAVIMPGIRLIPAAGHTPGGVMVEISSNSARLLCIGDLIHSSLEFSRPDYYSFLDSLPEEALALRTSGLAGIAAEGTLIFACHFPFPGIGRFVAKGDSLGWEPSQALGNG